MKLTVREIDLAENAAPAPAPGREATVRVRIRLEDGREADGAAAERIEPRWFDPDPAISEAQVAEQLRAAVLLARDAYLAGGEQTAFGHSLAAYGPQIALGVAQGLTGLTAGFGPALVDRAVLDALCRALRLPFAEAIQANVPGLAAPGWQADLLAFDLPAFLAGLAPRRRIAVRRTLDAGASVKSTKASWYKVILAPDMQANLERLFALAEALAARDFACGITLDANEQFIDGREALEFWRRMKGEARLARLVPRIAFIAQPIKRNRAPDADVSALAEEVPVVVDAGEDSFESFPRARRLGYTGITLRNGKGIYKALLDAARCSLWNAEEGRGRYFLCAETFGAGPGLALRQQLEAAMLLGIEHLECGVAQQEIAL